MDNYEQDRRTKLAQIQGLGLHPYSSTLVPDIQMADLVWNLTHGPNAPLSGVAVTQENGPIQVIAGRVMLYRQMGNLIFAQLRDSSGDFQIAFSKKRMTIEQFGASKKLDLGDLICAKGRCSPSQTGELTMWVEDFCVGAKSLIPPPAKYEGLTDIEIRLRQRYVDMWANPEVMKTFVARSNIIRYIRYLMSLNEFIEVETPMMHSLAGGAKAEPFKTHHKALDIPLFMRIAPELFLKRCLVGGMPKIFEIGRNFRNEGISTKHNPEFTALEAYQSYATWQDMASLVEELIIRTALAVTPEHHLEENPKTVQMARLSASFAGNRTMIANSDGIIDFSLPWRRVSMQDLVKEKTGWEFDGDSVRLLELYENEVESTLINPTFVTHPPAAVVPLARQSLECSGCADSFELVINGMEIGCGYSEENSPDKQLEKFVNQGGEIDQDFIRALKVGMPPAGGLGIGIDRLVMVLTGAKSARDVIMFPTLKAE